MTGQAKDAESIFGAAIQIPSSDDRAAFLDEACGGNLQLRAEVEKLVTDHFRAGSFLEQPALRADTSTATPWSAEHIGNRIGPYKLLQQVGEGGMGVVYLAEQLQPVKRRVAVKIIKHGMDTRQFVARFEAERQALAMMDHPNIARVLDAGCTETGRPYFVMEFVKGVPLTRFCDENRLTARERVELFVSVCHAVQHAHQKGIIHRDLKPSNVLVALYDDRPVPKVIDFGVAKATNQQLTEKTLFTQVGQIVGTWEYMSPEQAVLNQLDVDTRTDIYSLGVILYELLTGVTPLEPQRLRSAALEDLLRLIREEKPPKPSTRISSLGAAASATAAFRRTDAASLARTVRGDVDWIVMKALEKNRSRRYETANSLAADLNRYLNGEAIEARPPSTIYRLHKAVVRSRGVFATIAVVSLTLLVSAVTSSCLAVRAREAEKRAIAEQHTAHEQREIAVQERGQAERQASALAKQLHAADIGAAWRYLLSNNVAAASSHLRPHFPGTDASVLPFDGRYIWSQCQPQNLIEKQLDNQLNSVSFSRDGKRLAVTDIKGHVTVWDLDHSELPSPVWETTCHHGLDELDRDERYYTPVAFSPTDDILAFLDDKVEVVRLRDFRTNQEERLEGHTAFVAAIAFSPDGKLMATVSQDGTCRVRSTQDPAASREFCSPGNALWSVVFSPDGTAVAAGTNSGAINIWHLDSGRHDMLQCAMVRSTEGGYPEERDIVWQLAYSPDGTLLAAACADTTIKLWDLPRQEQHVLAGHRDQVRGLAFTDNGDMLVSGGRDGAIKIWSVCDLREIRTLRGHNSSIQELAVHDSQLATAGSDGAFRIWSLEQIADDDMYQIHQDIYRCYAHNMAFSPDGNKIAIHIGVLGNPVEVRLFDMTTRTLSPSLFTTPVFKMAMSRSGTLAALTCDHRIVCYDVTTDARDPQVARNDQLPASCLAFAEDGSKLVIGREDGCVELWDTETGTFVRDCQIASEALLHAVISGDELIGATSRSIVIWDVSGMAVVRKIPVDVTPRVLAFSHEAHRLAFFAQEGRVAIVDVDDSTSAPDYHAMGGAMSFRFIDEGKTLVSTNWSGQIGFWSVDPLQHRTDIVQTPRRVICTAVSPDGKTLATGGQGYIRLYRTE